MLVYFTTKALSILNLVTWFIISTGALYHVVVNNYNWDTVFVCYSSVLNEHRKKKNVIFLSDPLWRSYLAALFYGHDCRLEAWWPYKIGRAKKHSLNSHSRNSRNWCQLTKNLNLDALANLEVLSCCGSNHIATSSITQRWGVVANTHEPLRDKTNKMTCAQWRLRLAWASVWSVWVDAQADVSPRECTDLVVLSCCGTHSLTGRAKKCQ